MALRCVAALFVLALSTIRAADWADAARGLTRQVSSIAGPRQTVVLSFENRSSASAADVTAAEKALDAELRRAGLRLAASGSIAIRSILAENVREYVWTLQIGQGSEKSVALVAVARAGPPVATGQPALTLSASLMWSQPRRMLDAVALGPDRLLVLDTERITLRRDAARMPAASAVLNLPAPMPRDARGQLEVTGDAWLARLPGAVCAGALEPLSAACRPAEEPWPTPAGPSRMDRRRNFFEGPPPFYAAAAWKGIVLRAGVDRKVYVGGEIFDGWGSDIASIASGCGAGEQVLATLPSRPAEADGIQAHEFSGREPVAVTPVVEMAGPVSALWSAGDRVTAIAFNAKSSQYEAYSLAVRCAP